jgi:DNA polymerase
MGATAVDALLGKGVAVMRDRGKPIASELATTVLVTIHPSAVLRARDDRDEMFEGFVRDLRVAAKALRAER